MSGENLKTVLGTQELAIYAVQKFTLQSCANSLLYFYYMGKFLTNIQIKNKPINQNDQEINGIWIDHCLPNGIVLKLQNYIHQDHAKNTSLKVRITKYYCIQHWRRSNETKFVLYCLESTSIFFLLKSKWVTAAHQHNIFKISKHLSPIWISINLCYRGTCIWYQCLKFCSYIYQNNFQITSTNVTKLCPSSKTINYKTIKVFSKTKTLNTNMIAFYQLSALHDQCQIHFQMSLQNWAKYCIRYWKCSNFQKHFSLPGHSHYHL